MSTARFAAALAVYALQHPERPIGSVLASEFALWYREHFGRSCEHPRYVSIDGDDQGMCICTNCGHKWFSAPMVPT